MKICDLLLHITRDLEFNKRVDMWKSFSGLPSPCVVSLSVNFKGKSEKESTHLEVAVLTCDATVSLG